MKNQKKKTFFLKNTNFLREENTSNLFFQSCVKANVNLIFFIVLFQLK